MPLFNIAKQNIRKNINNYFMYMLSMVFSVIIFFIFKSIQFNKQIMEIMSSFTKLAAVFNASAFVIMVFSAIFIWYSNNFFIKNRKKEIGLYSLLGIEKKHIGKLLFYETLIIGLISIALGITFGTILSKFFIGLFLKITGFNVTIKFVLEIKAIISTFIVFGIIFLIISFQSKNIIYKYELIDLFKAQSKREKFPKVSMVRTILSVVLIVFGYINYLNVINSGNFQLSILLTTTTVILGTYLLFDSFILYIIKKSKNNKKKYYKGLNMISSSQLLYRIKGNSKTLATIAVLSATTLTAMGVSISYYKNFVSDFNKSYSFSYATSINDQVLINAMEKTIKSSAESKFKNKITFDFIVGNDTDKFKSELLIIPESKYIERARVLDEKNIFKLNSNKEAIFFNDFQENETPSSKTITLGNDTLTLNLKSTQKNSFVNTLLVRNVLVVKDSLYNTYVNSSKKFNVTAFNLYDNKNLSELDKDLENLIDTYDEGKYSKQDSFYKLSSYHKNYKENLVSIGTMMFIGTFIGLVFLACTGSIIFFKQLSEAQEESERYKILRKIGVSNKEINSSIKKQLGFIFLAPLIVGITHSTCAVKLIANSFNQSMVIVMLTTVIPYVFIYGIYYILTCKFYYKTITKVV